MNTKKQIDYLGVRLNLDLNLKNSSGYLDSLIKKGSSKLYTVNPEFIVDSFFDNNFRKELNSSDLNIIDGVGLLFGIKRYFKTFLSPQELKELKTIPGVDLVEEVLKLANQKGYSLFILGGSSRYEVAGRAAQNIKTRFPNINLIGQSSEFTYQVKDDSLTLEYINSCLKKQSLKELDIILVGYGHKNQEFWIGRNISKIPANLAIGVGGTLDYLAGVTSRAPKIIRNAGLEWFFRLVVQPHRFFRIIKATVIFSVLSRRLFVK